MNERIYNLPIFFACEEAIEVCVIADKLIGMILNSQTFVKNTYSFELISRLACNKLTRTMLPSWIGQKYNDYFLNYYTNFPCFIGGIVMENYFYNCLIFKMEILDTESSYPIHLFDLAFLNSCGSPNMSINRIKDDLFLTTTEAFHLFSNICYKGTTPLVFKNDENNSLPEFKYSKSDLTKPRNNQDSLDKPSHLNYFIRSFCKDYYQYIQDQLLTKNLSADFLLRLSGTDVIIRLSKDFPLMQQFIQEKIDLLLHNYDELSNNQKIMYYTLLLEAKDISWIPEIDIIMKENQTFIDSIGKVLLKPFPKDIGLKINKNKVFREYINSDYRTYLKSKR
ncbi:MAG: hypothetical protein JXA54_03380 [Candidatus Heimdallarchaeota archaeon]|nr:hypothetical protein [Candidatus Heimdallarchaeota archaeon]